MDWVAALILATAFTLSLLALLRTVPRRRFVTFLFLLLPTIFLSMRWAAYRDSWTAWFTGFGISIGLAALWWALVGRRLPPPRDGTRRVWTKDDPFE
jgi:hypothetical protein